ncbi:uncharacterized protein LOC108599343 [Drosophila busckii]|uniref:uncharacterized protein LOC108599343 n=1 Tax=Drosophila busckii TaxID=30019 RepID=UPI0014331F5C|nr:uncharacterized protein LOC108599343 [Drosophila busckii]
MTSIVAIILVSICHLLLRTSLVVKQFRSNVPEAPELATVVVYLAIMVQIYQNRLVPMCWSHFPAWLRFYIDLVGTVLCIEVCLRIFWCSWEYFIAQLLDSWLDRQSQLRLLLLKALIWLSALAVVGHCVYCNAKVNFLCKSVVDTYKCSYKRKERRAENIYL